MVVFQVGNITTKQGRSEIVRLSLLGLFHDIKAHKYMIVVCKIQRALLDDDLHHRIGHHRRGGQS